MNEIPVYLFTGFMDSGKTSLIKDTLFEQGFAKEGKSLVICCEDGDAEFTDEELEKSLSSCKILSLISPLFRLCSTFFFIPVLSDSADVICIQDPFCKTYPSDVAIIEAFPLPAEM